MTKIRLPYINEFRTRHGKTLRYVRLPGSGRRIPLPRTPGSAEFMEAYQAALAGGVPHPSAAARTQPGTVNAAVISYFNSAAFQMGAPDTRKSRRYFLEKFRQENGDKPIARLEPRHIHARSQGRHPGLGAQFRRGFARADGASHRCRPDRGRPDARR
jgi:hypothetical protein